MRQPSAPKPAVIVTSHGIVTLELCGQHALYLRDTLEPQDLIAEWAAVAAAEQLAT